MAVQIDDVDLSLDSTLVQRIQVGDASAFEELYQRNHDRLFRYCRYRLRDEHEAEEVVQEAFSRAWQHLPRFSGDRFYPWLKTIAANLCTDSGRRRDRTQPSAEVELGSEEGLEGRLVAQVDAALIRAALGRLPERQRQILHLRESEGLSYEELASRSGITVGSVESLLFRARQGLRKHFLALAGEALALVPGVGRMARSLRAWTVRYAGALSRLASSVESMGAAVGAAAVSALVGVVLSLPAWVGLSPASASAAGSTTRAVSAVSARPPASGTVSASSSSPAPNQPAPTAATARHRRLRDPLSLDSPNAAREVAGDPVKVQTPLAAVGVDPTAALAYTHRLVTHQLSTVLGGRK